MQFFNEGTVEIEIDGVLVFDAVDAEGGPLGLFTSRAAALGAQREVNIKKLLLKSSPNEDDLIEAYSCEIEYEDGSSDTLFAVLENGEWVETEELEDALKDAQTASTWSV